MFRGEEVPCTAPSLTAVAVLRKSAHLFHVRVHKLQLSCSAAINIDLQVTSFNFSRKSDTYVVSLVLTGARKSCRVTVYVSELLLCIFREFRQSRLWLKVRVKTFRNFMAGN